MVYSLKDDYDFVCKELESIRNLAMNQSRQIENLKKDKRMYGDWVNKEQVKRSELEHRIEIATQSLETALDECNYADITGDERNKDHYIKNTMRFIQEAMDSLNIKTPAD